MVSSLNRTVPTEEPATNYRSVLYSSYRDHYGAANPDLYPSQSVIESYELAYRRFLPDRRDARILDAGCGNGFTMMWLKSLGYTHVVGIDGAPDQAAFCASRGLDVTHADIFEYLKTHSGWDAIFSSDVIEHLQKSEVLAFLRSIRNALAPEGRAILRTDNASCLYGMTRRYIDFTHEVSYTEASLRQVLLASSFRKIEIIDGGIPFGFKPRRLGRWLVVKVVRAVLRLAFAAEVGTDAPRLLGKCLIACAQP